MGVRSVIRDLVALYLSYEIIKIWLFDSEFTPIIGILAIILIFFTVWFLLEKMGILPKV